jgi:SagB-type dehydrogenase family enzyme
VILHTAFDLQLRSVGGKLQIYNMIGGCAYAAELLTKPSSLFVLLQASKEWTSADELARLLSTARGMDLEVCTDVVGRLHDAGLLVEQSTTKLSTQAVDSAASWKRAGMRDALSYAVAADVIRRVDYSTRDGIKRDIELMRRYNDASSPPPLFLDMPGKVYPLSATGAEDDVISTEQKLSLAELSRYLWLGFAKQGEKNLPVTGRQLLKAAPSGGSRHPTEAFLVVPEKLDALTPGLYHYSVEQHALVQLSELVHDTDWIQENILRKDTWRQVLTSVSAAILLCSRVELSMYRYRENFSYRPINHDVGHIMEILRVATEKNNRKCFGAYSMNADDVAEAFGISAIEIPPLAYVVL